MQAETQNPAVYSRGLSRSFGPVRAVDRLDVDIPAREIVALVGPNGAGKTTLLLILAGLLAADSGEVRVAGFDPMTSTYDVHRSVGWMPDFFGVYESLTSLEYLEFFGAAYRLSSDEAGTRARELIALVGLEGFSERPVHVLSRGQKQRLGFARALVHRPRLLLLDEPASGLDPRARIELRKLVQQQRDEGVSVIVSSHILAELEEMSDSVVFMEAGRSVGYHRIGELPGSGRALRWRIRALNAEALAARLPAAAIVETARDGAAIVELESEAVAAELVAALVRDGVSVVEMVPLGRGLEAAFMGLSEVPLA